MTGYGGGDASKSGVKVTVDVSTLNRKQSEITITLPKDMDSLEPAVRDLLNKQISRGRLSVRITVQMMEGAPTVQFNDTLAGSYLKALRTFAKKLNLSGDIGIEKLLDIPGVVENRIAILEPKAVWPLVRSALKKAMQQLLAMRDREGKNLEVDLVKRIGGLRKILSKIETLSANLPKKYKENLLKRIRKNGLDKIVPDDPRLLQEIVLFVDRSDITEEITRLKSHFSQFDHALKTNNAIGRMLDFLAQEMGREINTIGSKANDADLSGCVVLFKTELEKFREQVQNVE